MSERIITLTTDFGLSDPYVGIMKGVILGIAPETILVDLTHDVQPQNVQQAAFFLLTAYRYFPRSTIHLGVVDPGVGTERRPIAVESTHGTFVGPDNGMFWPTLHLQRAVAEESGTLRQVRAVVLANEEFRLQPASNTFHGRDIFAPAAAYLATGVPLSAFGPAIERMHPGHEIIAKRHGREVHGRIVHVDRFGNLISNVIPRSPAGKVVVSIGDCRVEGLRDNYQETHLAALVGSHGFIEIAARNGSAAEILGTKVGDAVVVQDES